MLAETGCDGLMVGRGADGNPWIFSELRAMLLARELPEPVQLSERFRMIIRHLEMLIAHKGERVAVKEMRRHINSYIKGLPHAAEYRAKFNQIESEEDCKAMLQEFGSKIDAQGSLLKSVW